MPRAVEDKTLKGQPYGAEKQQNEMRAAAAVKPVQPEFDGSFGEIPPETEEPEEVNPADLTSPDMEIPGLGNLGDILFGETDRPEESPNTPPQEWQGPSWAEDSPSGPSQEYLQMLHDPGVDVTTKTLIDLVSRMNILRPPAGQSRFIPRESFTPAPPAE